ncbi:zf-HC2 domain-containing protein [Marinobacter daepoensis]|uniref:Zf-HC2 domain-containing protein n=2 Tax=Marinobacter daepoensis TaxID=262077 RepID=A0ABS3BAW5_9GAMM|nr:zf-HC2 domain-containing protein [Marinobacter daepoensis]MBN7768460.1 zf-HC2 domain-containing protein [Marinobacter daepoensis]MBY6033091.1 zf-HC2 domain-containing protein [Marinobacter daepoensis]MBY6079197.1 zf-HC2 domain-containing protein [Marinobacter daepoensis]
MNMSCQKIRSQLPDYVRSALPEIQSREVQAHLKACPECRRSCRIEATLMTELAERYETEPPGADFETRVFSHLPATGGRGVHVAWGTAVAAALVLGLFLGQANRWEHPEQAANESALAVSEPVLAPVERTVRLAFTAGEALDDVTLTLSLPPHVELTGLPGQHQVRWQVSLEQGDNVLALPLRILFPGAGELVAELDAEGRQKVFRAPIPGYPGADNALGKEKEPAT